MAVHSLRDGDFLTDSRMRVIPRMLLTGFAFALVFLAVTAHGLRDYTGHRPLGTDYADIYAAGRAARAGHPTAPFAPRLQYIQEQKLFGPQTDFYGWHYPPYFLLLAAPLAALPYLWSLAVWQAASFAVYLGALAKLAGRSLAPHQWLVPAVAFPAVFVNLTHGHNGFLTAGLMGFALGFLDERPLLAGMCFGLMVYKPQFGLMIPLVLAASRRWKAFLAASLCVAGLSIAVTVIFGPAIWPAFLASTHFTRTEVLEQGGAGFFKIDSIFAWIRMWSGPLWLAYGAQALVTVWVGAVLVRLWRQDASFATKGLALCLAALLSTPYSLDYDMMVLAPGLLLAVREGLEQGFPPWRKTTLAGLWLAPFLARPVAGALSIPLGIWAVLAGFALITWPKDVARDRARPARPTDLQCLRS